jgi:hypothetical protein
MKEDKNNEIISTTLDHSDDSQLQEPKSGLESPESINFDSRSLLPPHIDETLTIPQLYKAASMTYLVIEITRRAKSTFGSYEITMEQLLDYANFLKVAGNIDLTMEELQAIVKAAAPMFLIWSEDKLNRDAKIRSIMYHEHYIIDNVNR